LIKNKLLHKLRFLLSGFIVIGICCNTPAQKQFHTCREIEPVEFYAWYLAHRKTTILIDVRDPEAFQKNHITGAMSAPADKNLTIIADTIDADLMVVIYDDNGDDSLDACIYMAQKGLNSVFSLRGGLIRWNKFGLPIEEKRKLKK
jgi:rhodanese-related sulfurtransferase